MVHTFASDSVSVLWVRGKLEFRIGFFFFLKCGRDPVQHIIYCCCMSSLCFDDIVVLRNPCYFFYMK